MKSILIITIFLTSAVLSYGQTPSSYDKILLAKINTLDSIVKVQGGQINTLVWSNSKILALMQVQDEAIKKQNEYIKTLQDEFIAFKNGIVPFNKITYDPPLKGETDKTDSTKHTVSLDAEALRRLLGFEIIRN